MTHEELRLRMLRDAEICNARMRRIGRDAPIYEKQVDKCPICGGDIRTNLRGGYQRKTCSTECAHEARHRSLKGKRR